MMPTAKFFREKAGECCRLLEIAVKPEVVAQLEIWVREFEEASRNAEADAALTFALTPNARTWPRPH
jgi:hypothetical protein